jgi:hypothetical protein
MDLGKYMEIVEMMSFQEDLNRIIYRVGGSGDDELYGGDDDTLRGGSGKDYFDCGFGFDIILDFDASDGDTHTTDCEVVYEM